MTGKRNCRRTKQLNYVSRLKLTVISGVLINWGRKPMRDDRLILVLGLHIFLNVIGTRTYHAGMSITLWGHLIGLSLKKLIGPSSI